MRFPFVADCEEVIEPWSKHFMELIENIVSLILRSNIFNCMIRDNTANRVLRMPADVACYIPRIPRTLQSACDVHRKLRSSSSAHRYQMPIILCD